MYTAWNNKQLPVDNILWERFSHLAIASVYPLTNGHLESSTVDTFIEPLVAKAKEQGKTVILSVGGAGKGSEAFKSIMADPALKNTFIENLVSYVKQHKVDGVDIDWEYWSYQSEQNKGGNDPVESQYLVELLKSLRETLSPSTILTVDIAPGEWLGAQYKVELQEYVDYVNLMAFDFTGSWDNSDIAHHADYRTFRKAIKHTLNKGFKADKLLIGLPAYGIEFINGSNKTIRHVPYREIIDAPNINKSALHKGKYKNTFFETKSLLNKKSRLILNKELAGVFLFDLASDHKANEHSLLEFLSPHIIPLDKNTNKVP
jgi:chitinase